MEFSSFTVFHVKNASCINMKSCPQHRFVLFFFRKIFVGGLSAETTKGIIPNSLSLCEKIPKQTSKVVAVLINRLDHVVGEMYDPLAQIYIYIYHISVAESLQDYFSEFGAVTDCIVMVDNMSKRSR